MRFYFLRMKKRINTKNTFTNLVHTRQWGALREIARSMEPADIADVLLELEKPDRVLLFRALPRAVAGDVFSELEHEDEETLLHELTDEETRTLLANLDPDDRTELLEELPGGATQKLLNLLDEKERARAKELLGYPDESLGRLMTPGYVAVRPRWSVEEALAHIKKRDPKSETVDVIFVTDDAWRLLGVLRLRTLVFAEPNEKIEALMKTEVVKALATDDREGAVSLMQKYDLAALPVVDSTDVLVGIVTFDDVFDVAEEEATEDFHKSAAIGNLGTGFGQAGIGLLYRKRAPWLVVLVFMNLIAGAIIAMFEETIAAAVVLVSFLPLLIGSAGNAGAQAATLSVRSIALGEVRLGDWFSLLTKEFIVSLSLGLTMAFFVWLLGFYRGGLEVALVVALSMVIVVMVGSLIGMILPFILHKLKADPAVASTPLVTTVADVFGVLVYFALATAILTL